MTSWFLTKKAKLALRDIYVHTHNTWGVTQADKYLDGLYEAFELIALKRVAWRAINPTSGIVGFYCRYQKHQIFWRVQANGQIGIAAIVHEAMLKSDRLMAAFAELPPNSHMEIACTAKQQMSGFRVRLSTVTTVKTMPS